VAGVFLPMPRAGAFVGGDWDLSRTKLILRVAPRLRRPDANCRLTSPHEDSDTRISSDRISGRLFGTRDASRWTKPPAKLTGQEFRRKGPNHFLVVTGDFNGDGIQDKAVLLVNQHTQKLGFFICLTTATGCDWHRLEMMDIVFLDVMGIAKVKPGQYETACGKGYWDCGKDEPQKLSTRRGAVEFFKDESASSVYVYNPRKQKFISVATSD
jgi:hypothetical protein